MRNQIKWVLTSFHPRVTWSPPDIPDPEKSRVKTVMFEGSNIIAASLASALHPLAWNQDEKCLEKQYYIFIV